MRRAPGRRERRPRDGLLSAREFNSASLRPVPDGFHPVTPNIIVDDGPRAIAFLCKALGAEEIVRLTMPNGTIVHSELKIDDSRINLGESMDGWPAHGLVAQVHVADSDELFARAVAVGAEVLMPMTHMFISVGRRSLAFDVTR
jgi:uncharacterized glyoxalase superfamily protein PhnB